MRINQEIHNVFQYFNSKDIHWLDSPEDGINYYYAGKGLYVIRDKWRSQYYFVKAWTMADALHHFNALPKKEIYVAIESSEHTDTHECELIERAEAQAAIMFAARRYTVAHEAHGVGHVVWSDELISVNDAMQSLRDVQTYVSSGNSERLRPKGEWIVDEGQQVLMQERIADGEDWKVCSVCGCGFMVGHEYNTDRTYHKTFHNFCPNCGADMRGGQDE